MRRVGYNETEREVAAFSSIGNEESEAIEYKRHTYCLFKGIIAGNLFRPYCCIRDERKEAIMLPPFIIEQIRKREERTRREEEERPAIRLPLDDMPPLLPEPEADIDDDENRGVVIIDLCSPF